MPALQDIFNLANSLEINRRKLVGIQYSRSELPQTSLTPTKNPWRFKLSISGAPWNTMRPLIEELDAIDRYLPQTIQIGFNTRFNWLYGYLGEAATTPVGLSVQSFTNNSIVIEGVDTLGLANGALVFKSGDMIQIDGSPWPYTIVNDVPYDSSGTIATAMTHRPNVSPYDPANRLINVAENCQIQMFCPKMPTYQLIPGATRIGNNGQVINNAIVEWSDDFELYEWLTS